MYLAIGKEDIENRSIASKDQYQVAHNKDNLRVIHLGSLKVKRIVDRTDRNLFPDKPKGWQDKELVMLGMVYSDVKTIGAVVMHQDEAKALVDSLKKTVKSKKGSDYYIKSKDDDALRDI